MTTDQLPNRISATIIPEVEQMDFLPSLFGEHLMLRGEAMIFGWMRRLSEDYQGGVWNFYRCSNNALFMAPKSEKHFHISVNTNGFTGDLSAEGAGIVANLFALCHLSEQTEDDSIIQHYHLLRDYALDHAEASQILSAID